MWKRSHGLEIRRRMFGGSVTKIRSLSSTRKVGKAGSPSAKSTRKIGNVGRPVTKILHWTRRTRPKGRKSEVGETTIGNREVGQTTIGNCETAQVNRLLQWCPLYAGHSTSLWGVSACSFRPNCKLRVPIGVRTRSHVSEGGGQNRRGHPQNLRSMNPLAKKLENSSSRAPKGWWGRNNCNTWI